MCPEIGYHTTVDPDGRGLKGKADKKHIWTLTKMLTRTSIY